VVRVHWAAGGPERILVASSHAAWDLSHESFGRIPARGLDLAGPQPYVLAFAQLGARASTYVIEVARADAREKIVPLSQAEAEL
jgi:hypothetical protein